MRWRKIVDAPDDGAWNMAVDEAMLDAYVEAGTVPPPPTLRLYAWQPPCLSLGRGQVAHGAHCAPWLRRHGVQLVRRPSGGAAVLHEHERTYAVVGALGRPPFDHGVVDTYARIARAIAGALSHIGVEATIAADATTGRPNDPDPSCFAVLSTQEVAWGGRKLVGAAQLRRRGAFLQHGSILLRADAERLARALGRGVTRSEPMDLERASGREVGLDELDRAIALGFSEEFSIEFEPGGLSPSEQARAARLASWKYASASWTLAGEIGARERSWGAL